MIQGRDFIFTGLQPWDIPIGSNAKDIALEVSKNNRVLYVNTPLDMKTYRAGDTTPDYIQRKRVIDKQIPPLRQLSDTFWVLDLPFTILPINPLPDGAIFDLFNYYNNRKIYSFVKKIIKKLDFKDYLLFMDNDVYRSFYAKEMLKPTFSIYYRRDNLVSNFWKKHVRRLEDKLCAKSDIVTANSIYLADMVRSFNSKAYDVGQGLDLSDYSSDKSYTLPEDMKGISGPIVGYAGWITSLRLDADLLYDVALAMPEISLVMVGSEDDYFIKHKLHSLLNVHFLGLKQSKQIPDYIAAFDICINPQLMNEITMGNYPRKIDEYLSLGKRTIATKTPAMQMFESYVWNCRGAQEYIQAIREAIDDHSAERISGRIACAREHTWENSVKKIYACIEANK